MIGFGTKSEIIKSEVLTEQCPNCNKSNVVQMNIFQRYVYCLFLVPLFPFEKIGYLQCSFCKQLLKPQEMPRSFGIKYVSLKAKVKHLYGYLLELE